MIVKFVSDGIQSVYTINLVQTSLYHVINIPGNRYHVPEDVLKTVKKVNSECWGKLADI